MTLVLLQRLAAELPHNVEEASGSGVQYTDFGARSDRLMFVDGNDACPAVQKAVGILR